MDANGWVTIIGAVFFGLVTMLGMILKYLGDVAKKVEEVKVETAAVAKHVVEKVGEVKDSLQESLEDIHSRVNGHLTALKNEVAALRQEKADATGLPADRALADKAAVDAGHAK